LADPAPRSLRTAKRIALRTPVLGRVLRDLDAVRRHRDRLLEDNQRLTEEVRRLRQAPVTEDGQRERLKVEMLQRPSLLARTAALYRTRVHARELLGHADPVWQYNSKLAGSAFARELGLRVAERLTEPVPLEQLRPVLDRRCVVKPTGGASARGIAPLVPVGRDRWMDLFDIDLGPQSWGEIQEKLARFVAGGKVEANFYCEEMVEGPSSLELPYDWKMLCVGGEVIVAQCRDARNQRAGRHSRFRYWSRDWDDLGQVHHAERVDPDLPPPRHPEELIRSAEQVATHLDVPFVRVDLFEDAAGVLFSEITPQPGSALWFGEQLDVAFGTVWDRAEARSWRR
jgi:hypothetical protein